MTVCRACAGEALTEGGCPFCIYVVRDSIRHCCALTGPGDPRWHGKPGQYRIRTIKSAVTQDSAGRFYFYDRGQRRLRTAEDYAVLNRSL